LTEKTFKITGMRRIERAIKAGLKSFSGFKSPPGMWAIVNKELGDHFNSIRFFIMSILIFLAGLSAVYVAALTIRESVASAPELDFVFLWLFNTSGKGLPPFTTFVGFLAPLMGIALGFDAVNGELNRGTMSSVLAQPVYRDAFINGKFFAGLITISLMLLALFTLVGGLGLILIGIPPVTEEVLRIFFYLVLSVLYVAFWLSLAVLFSILFRQTATSALSCIGSWLFFTIFFGLLVGLLANALVPLDANAGTLEILRHERLLNTLLRFSPTILYYEAATMLLIPYQRFLGPVLLEQIEGAIPGPLPLGQSLTLVWPHFVGLLAATLLIFAACYIKFMRMEIRSS